MTQKDYREIAAAELERLRKLAEKKGLTPIQLAAITGFERSTIYRMLDAKYIPKLDNYLKLKDAIEK